MIDMHDLWDPIHVANAAICNRIRPLKKDIGRIGYAKYKTNLGGLMT